MPLDSQILDQLAGLVGRRDLSHREFQDWMAGDAMGGPNHDGMYPLTDSTGFTRMLPSPARVNEIATKGANGIYVYPDEFDPLAGSGPTHDDLPAFNAMFANAYLTGRVPSGRPAVRYYLSDTLTIDPSRTMFEGNACILDFRLKQFLDPANLPELVSDSEMNTGQGWHQSIYATFQPLYNGLMDAISQWPNDGEQRYVELGQQIMCKAGDKVEIKVEFEDIQSRAVGVNTFRTLTFSLRRPSGTPGASIGGGANVGAVGTASNSEAGFGPGFTKTFIAMPTADNPYLRIQSNAAFSIRSISVKVVPMNACVLMRVPAEGQLRGHNYRNFRNFKIAGKSGAQAPFADGVLFDTLVAGWASRTNFYNLDISDGIGRGLVFGNRTYLNNFYSCRIVAAIACVDTLSNSADAGENIAFFGGNLGGGNIGIRNEHGFAIRLFGTSIDFSRQWLVGGAIKMFGGWLETNPPNPWNGPLIDATGDIMLFNTRVQVDGAALSLPGAPFRVQEGALLHIEAEGPYNLNGPNGELCEGGGRFYFRGIGGRQKEIASITKRDEDHNILGAAGSFESDNIAIPAWMIASAGQQQLTRHKIGYSTIATVTGDVVRGSSVINNLSVSPSATYVGRKVLNPEAGSDRKILNFYAATPATGNTTAGSNVITGVTGAVNMTNFGNKPIWGAGIPHGARVISYTSTTLTLDRQCTATAAAVAISCGRQLEMSAPWEGPDATGVTISLLSPEGPRAEMTISTDTARTGTRSLKIQKVGIGGGTVCRARIAIPVEKFRAFGAEWYYRVLPNSVTGLTSLTASVFFQTYFVQLTEQGGLVPVEGPSSDYISDLPQTAISLEEGRDWTRLGTATNRRDAASGHTGYTPEWATHMMITIDISSTPSGFALYIDDVHGNMM